MCASSGRPGLMILDGGRGRGNLMSAKKLRIKAFSSAVSSAMMRSDDDDTGGVSLEPCDKI